MSTQTKNAKSGSTKEYFAQGAQRMYSAETDVQTAAPIRDGDVIKSSIDAPVPTDDVDEQIMPEEQTMREIIGAPIETNEVSMHTSHNAPYLNSDAPDNATTSNVEVGAAEPNTPTPSDRNDKTSARPSVVRGGKTSVGTVSSAPATHTTLTEGGKPSAQTVHTASIEPCKTTVPIPQTVTAELSADSGDARNSIDITPTAPTLDTDPTRRTVKQRKSDLDEYCRRYMKIPRIADRKPVFVSRATRDRLDRIVRLLGERGMSVSGLIENIALRHLETHEPDIEYWRKM